MASLIPEGPGTEEKPPHLDLLPEETAGRLTPPQRSLCSQSSGGWGAGWKGSAAPAVLSFLLTGPRAPESHPLQSQDWLGGLHLPQSNSSRRGLRQGSGEGVRTSGL